MPRLRRRLRRRLLKLTSKLSRLKLPSKRLQVMLRRKPFVRSPELRMT